MDKDEFEIIEAGYGDLSEQEAEPDSLLRRITRILVAVVLVAGLLYVFGIRQLFFYGRTPAGIRQEELAGAVDAKTLVVPLDVFIVSGDGDSGTERDSQDAMRMIENASRIWNQAGIMVEAMRVEELNVSEEKISVFYSNPWEFISELPGLDPGLITVVLVRHLRGINGLAFGGVRSVAVADHTTSYDFRVLAHEIGHILGLDHTRGNTRLMRSGATGTELSTEEIMLARETAGQFVKGRRGFNH